MVSVSKLFQSQIKDLHDFLRFCVQKRPTLLGSTVFGVRDIHQALGPFVTLHEEKPRPLYFVKVILVN